MALTNTFPFDTPGNYTLSDSNKIEITGGKLQLKQQTYTNEVWFAPFYDSTDVHRATDADSDTTGTVLGSAVITGNKLDVTSGTGSGVSFTDSDKTATAVCNSIFTVRLKYTPNFTGNPSANAYLFSSGINDFTNKNRFDIFITTGGELYISLYTNTGSSLLVNKSFGSLGCVSGTEMEVEVNIDCTSGVQRAFKDGSELGTASSSTGTRDAAEANFIIIGNTIGVANLYAQGYLRDVQIFDNIQHSADYTPAANSPYDYFPDNPTCLTSGFGMDSLDSLAETTLVATAPNVIKYAIQIGGTDYYYNTSTNAVEASTGYAQTNTLAEINANAAQFDATMTPGSTVKIKLYLHCDTGFDNEQVSLDTLTMVYDPWVADGALTQVHVSDYLYDSEGNGISGATVSVTHATFINGAVIGEKTVTTTTRSTGYWEIDLVETTTPNVLVYFTFSYTDPVSGNAVSFVISGIIPNQAQATLTDFGSLAA